MINDTDWKGLYKFGGLAALIAMLIGLLDIIINFIPGQGAIIITAFSMLELSSQYAAATTETQKSLLAAAGQAMLARGEDFTPGSFMGFFLTEAASIIMAMVMLRSKVFSKLTALVALFGYGCLLMFVVWATFIPVKFQVAMIFAIIGGLLSLVAYILIARRLFQLACLEKKLVPPEL